MDARELERELLELCDRVAGARERYRKLSDTEATVRTVSTLGSTSLMRDAKHALGDVVRTQALAEDNLWRQLVIGFANKLVNEQIDLAADEFTQVEVQAEVGGMGTHKLYVHQGGKTIFRMCKLKPEQILIGGFRVDTLSEPEAPEA